MGGNLSLYRKYRPQSFGDVAGQESVTRALLGALESNGISHAYLFTGPRGSGKTTTARLLAKAVNCKNSAKGEPCNACELCLLAGDGRFLDIVELDAASNRGIDEVRQLREQVVFSPTKGRYKTYILDEVHMLTKDAANAFLKTLEEPPPHVLFVLATTEAHKVMATIASRCQRHDFQRIPLAAAVARLEQVIAAEKIKGVAREALEEIARRGDGSLRDMLGLLEQVAATGAKKIGIDEVRAALGLARSLQIEALGGAMVERNAGGILAGLAHLHEQGIEPATILSQVTDWFRDALERGIASGAPAKAASPASERTIAILARLSSLSQSVRQALSPRMTLEIGFLEASHAQLGGGPAELIERLDRLSRTVADLEARWSGGAPGPAPAVESPPAPPILPRATPVVADSSAPRAAPAAVDSAPPLLASVPSPPPAGAPKGRSRLHARDAEAVAAGSPPTESSAAVARPLVAVRAAPLGGELEERASGSRAGGPGFNNSGSPAALPRLPQDESAGAADELDERGDAQQPPDMEDAGVSGPWNVVLEALRRESPLTHALAKEGRALPPAAKKLRILFRHEFHRGRLGEPNHQALLRKAVREAYGAPLTVSLEEDGTGEGRAAAEDPPDRDWARKRLTEDRTVQLIVDTFGGEIIDLE